MSLAAHMHTVDSFVHFQTTGEDRIEISIFFELFKRDLDLGSFSLRNDTKIEFFLRSGVEGS